MGFRTVIISSRAKLELRLNYLVVRGEKERKIYIDEVNTLIIQSTAVAITASLLCELVKRNVTVIFCDEKYNPSSSLIPYYGAHNTPKKYKVQFSWDELVKARVWKEIVRLKIIEQAQHLYDRGFREQGDMLISYSLQLEDNDVTNREGHSAKVYFNCLLGNSVSRREEHYANKYLNYGYAILLSAFNREIVSCGYLTQIGIWHDNEFNQFNLACDLMEPFRVIVDRLAFSMSDDDHDFKKKMVNILNYQTLIGGKNTTLDLAIRTYTRSVLQALEQGDENLIIYPQHILSNEQ